jgi:replicative DNA helicase
MGNENFDLPIKHISVAVEEADIQIKEGLSQQQTALKTRWGKVNYALVGGFRFGWQYIVAGASGSGKSFFVNMLHEDFTNPNLNANFRTPFKILHFGFEMTSADEVLRKYSTVAKKSYRELLSTDGKISNEVLLRLESYKPRLAEKEIYYVEDSGSIPQILKTIENFQIKNPRHKLIISFDHTLLAEYSGEQDEVKLVSSLSKALLKTRKKIDSMNIIIGQLNDKIEQVDRLGNHALHYPTKTDLHGSKAIFQDADAVMVLHAPEKLGLETYGKKHFPTQDLIALHLIKMRKGEPFFMRMKQDFGNGNMKEWQDDNKENQLKIV